MTIGRLRGEGWKAQSMEPGAVSCGLARRLGPAIENLVHVT